MNLEHRQRRHRTRVDWGLRGAEAIASDADIAVIVDVLSFTTTVSVALDRGIGVVPHAGADTEEVARRHDASVAFRRSQAAPGRITLSTGSIRSARDVPARLVLPSPNGSTIAEALATTPVLAAASLRTATAIAYWIARTAGPDDSVAIIAAGERWPDGSLRPAIEDFWGAGAVVAALAAVGRLLDPSPEADAAQAAWTAVADDPSTALRDCSSGRELIALGFDDDVAVAAEVGESVGVPILRQGIFVDAASGGLSA